MNILFVGAHPDDIELGCAGTLIEHIKQGDNVFSLIVTDGEQGLIGNGEMEHSRIDETINALMLSGVKKANIIFLHLQDTMLWKERQSLISSLETICGKYNIDRIYTHTENTYHQDHLVVNEETIRASRNDNVDILAYETNGSTKSKFHPNYFVDISEALEKKLDIFRCHKSQMHKFASDIEFIKSLAKFRASQAKFSSYAEGFEVIRMTWNTQKETK